MTAMSRKLILIVEDTPDDEALILKALRKTNIDVDVAVAHDGEEALDYLLGSGSHAGRDPGRQPHVVLSDLKLPKVDGLELLSRIRGDHRTQLVPVVLLSSSTQESDVRSAYRRGANSYAGKPIDSERFIEV